MRQQNAAQSTFIYSYVIQVPVLLFLLLEFFYHLFSKGSAAAQEVC